LPAFFIGIKEVRMKGGKNGRNMKVEYAEGKIVREKLI